MNGLSDEPFDPSLIIVSTGIAEKAECRVRRSATPLTLSIHMADSKQLETRILYLPSESMCTDEFMRKLVGREVVLTDYLNTNLGLALGDEIIIEVADNLWFVENTNFSFNFTLLLAVIASLPVVIRLGRRSY